VYGGTGFEDDEMMVMIEKREPLSKSSFKVTRRTCGFIFTATTDQHGGRITQ